MRTSLKYSVQREPTFNDRTGREGYAIRNRGYTFEVSGAADEKNHKDVVSSFESFLESRGVACHGFGEGTWDDCMRNNDTKSFLFLDIPVKDMDDKEYIAELYREWKERCGW